MGLAAIAWAGESHRRPPPGSGSHGPRGWVRAAPMGGRRRLLTGGRGVPMVEARRDDEFDELMARLRSGDDGAATAVFRRYVDRLIALAASRFEPRMRDPVDVEDVVLSAYKSFFVRNSRGEFDLTGWDDLWSLLAFITLRKCGKRRRSMRAARRDVRREVSWSIGPGRLVGIPDRAPTPDEAAAFAETVERLFQAMSTEDRPIV